MVLTSLRGGTPGRGDRYLEEKAMRMRVASIVLVLFAPIAGAQTTTDVADASGKSCETWNADRKTNNTKSYVPTAQWVSRYLREAVDGPKGVVGHDPLRGMPYDAVVSWLDKHCGQHPQQKIGEAADALFKDTMARAKGK
jgi:hypothetical protein